MSTAYHSQAVAWYRDGSIFNPPTWFPYGSMGFPAWWSVQSGAWYVPLQILSWLGIHYTFFNAASLQAAHVLAGAIGMFFLLRAENFGRVAACLGSLVFHYSSIFFSNAQHTDIIRSAALLPILLCALHPRIINRNSFMPALASFVVFQFMIASYPGNIISTIYMGLVCVGFWLFRQPNNMRFAYLLKIAIAGLSGVLMAQLKFIAPILEVYSKYSAKLNVLDLHSDHLWTLIFPHDLPFLTQDPTMQSLWSPPVALVLVFFAAIPLRNVALPAVLIIMALTFAGLESISPEIRSLIPGLSVSRQAHSDWRPELHLGMTLLTCVFFEAIYRQHISAANLLVRFVLATLALIVVSLFAMHAGYSVYNIQWEVAALLATISLVAVCITWGKTETARKTSLFIVLTCAIISTSFVMHFVRVPRTWLTKWDTAIEAAYFGGSIESLLEAPKRTQWPRRPARETYGTDSFTLAGQLDLRFNRAWYAQEFGTFGYDNLRSREFLQLAQEIQDPGTGPLLLAFLTHPGQMFLHKANESFSVEKVARCAPEKEVCADDLNASGEILSYGLRSNQMSISTPYPIEMVENELYYKGWTGRLCNESNNCQMIEAVGTPQGLRAWAIPSGTWHLETTYITPHSNLAKSLFTAGALLLIAQMLLPFLVRRMKPDVQAS